VGDSINIVCQPLAENTDFIAIEIRDTGIGMTPEQIEKVMSQVNFTRRGTKNESGSGFGIMICRDMIEQMQGTFSLESKADDGTTVKIMLPREKT
jgi:signal transduction histidine kinase